MRLRNTVLRLPTWDPASIRFNTKHGKKQVVRRYKNHVNIKIDSRKRMMIDADYTLAESHEFNSTLYFLNDI